VLLLIVHLESRAAIIETLALVATQYQCGADTCCPFVNRDGTVAGSLR
jgi:hypothetical protein